MISNQKYSAIISYGGISNYEEAYGLDWINSALRDLDNIHSFLKSQCITLTINHSLKSILADIYANLSLLVTSTDSVAGTSLTTNSSWWLQLSNILNLMDLFSTTLQIQSCSRLMSDYVKYLVKMMILSLIKFTRNGDCLGY